MELLTLISESPAGYGSILFLTLLLASSFIRICLVICFINIGLGLNNILGNIWGLLLALALSFHVSTPLIEESSKILSQNSTVSNSAVSSAQKISLLNTYFKTKLETSTSKETLSVISGEQQEPTAEKKLNVLILAHVLSETKIAFSAGLKILLPFIVIDLVVAHIFTALGIVTISAYGLSFLLKILAINFTGGLDLIIHNLLQSF
jgi:flagellar biosynthetic protein FliP